MNARLWACVVTGVLVAHVAVIYIIHHWRAAGVESPAPAGRNFESRTVRIVDARGRTVVETSEFTVTTKLADAPDGKAGPPPAPARTP